MLAIRLQRTGRSGHAQFRVIVQDSRFSPTRGRVVSYLGSYDPHTKKATIDSQKAVQYLENGAQPSDRAARLLQKEGIKLPAWVKLDEPKERSIRHPEKRRSTRPAEPEAKETPVAEEPSADEAVTEPPAEEPAAEETPAEEAQAEAAPAADTAEPEAAAAAPAAEEVSDQPAENS